MMNSNSVKNLNGTNVVVHAVHLVITHGKVRMVNNLSLVVLVNDVKTKVKWIEF